MDVGSVNLSSPWHQFRAFSELKNESRGGYLEGEISVPQHVSRIRISLATHGPTPESHVNLLFETPRNKIATHCQEMKPSDHGIILHKVNDAFELEQPSYWPNAQANRPQFWINGKLVLGKNNLQLTICKAVQKGQSKISVNAMVKYLNLGQFKGDLEKARLKVIFDDNPPIYSKVILDKAKYLIKIESIETRYICDRADQIVTIFLNKSVKITQDKCLKLVLFRDLWSEEIESKTFEICYENVVKFKVNASSFGACQVYVLVTIDDPDIDTNSLYDQISDDITIEIKKHFEHPEHPCFCKIFSAANFKPTTVRKAKRSRPYPVQRPSGSLGSQTVPTTSGGARPRTIRRQQRPNQSYVVPPRFQADQQSRENVVQTQTSPQHIVPNQEPQIRQPQIFGPSINSMQFVAGGDRYVPESLDDLSQAQVFHVSAVEEVSAVREELPPPIQQPAQRRRQNQVQSPRRGQEEAPSPQRQQQPQKTGDSVPNEEPYVRSISSNWIQVTRHEQVSSVRESQELRPQSQHPSQRLRQNQVQAPRRGQVNQRQSSRQRGHRRQRGQRHDQIQAPRGDQEEAPQRQQQSRQRGRRGHRGQRGQRRNQAQSQREHQEPQDREPQRSLENFKDSDTDSEWEPEPVDFGHVNTVSAITSAPRGRQNPDRDIDDIIPSINALSVGENRAPYDFLYAKYAKSFPEFKSYKEWSGTVVEYYEKYAKNFPEISFFEWYSHVVKQRAMFGEPKPWRQATLGILLEEMKTSKEMNTDYEWWLSDSEEDFDWLDDGDDEDEDQEKVEQLLKFRALDRSDALLQLRTNREEKLTEDEKNELKSKAVALKKAGNDLYVSGANTEAFEKYCEALDTCPLDFKEDRAILFSNKAAALIKLNKKEHAIEECSKAIELNPDYVKALTRRGRLYEDTDRPHEAFADFARVFRLDPGHKEAKIAFDRLPDKIKEKDERIISQNMAL